MNAEQTFVVELTTDGSVTGMEIVDVLLAVGYHVAVVSEIEQPVADAIRQWESEVTALRAELEEEDDLRERMEGLLNGVALALKGGPAPLSMHSWHDLPELAAEVKRKADRP